MNAKNVNSKRSGGFNENTSFFLFTNMQWASSLYKQCKPILPYSFEMRSIVLYIVIIIKYRQIINK
mgnify:CR=1 FL=1